MNYLKLILKRFKKSKIFSWNMRLSLAIILVLLLVGCSSGLDRVTGDAVKEIPENTGIKISNAEMNDNGEFVHNIFNFDTVDRTIKVTTLCYGEGFQLISDNDSYVMTLPPNSVAGWKPSCPENTVKYQIDIQNATKADQ